MISPIVRPFEEDLSGVTCSTCCTLKRTQSIIIVTRSRSKGECTDLIL